MAMNGIVLQNKRASEFYVSNILEDGGLIYGFKEDAKIFTDESDVLRLFASIEGLQEDCNIAYIKIN